MKLPGSIASIGMGGGFLGGSASSAALRSAFHFRYASLAICTRVAWLTRFAQTAAELFLSIRSRARTATARPGVFRSPEAATTQVQRVIGSDHDRDAQTRRAVPTKLDATPSKGTATCSGRTPAPWAARNKHRCQAGV